MPVDENTLLIDSPEEAMAWLAAIETADEIAQNWRWIFVVGTINVVTGIACLMFPILATQAAEIVLAAAIFVTGCFLMTTVTYTAAGTSHHFFWLGLVQVVLAIIMFFHPLFTLTVLTIFIAIMFMAVGAFQVALTRQNPNMAGRSWTLVSGILAILMSVIITLGMPFSSWYTIGVLLGVNLLNIGLNRIALSCYGRSLANSEEWNRRVTEA